MFRISLVDKSFRMGAESEYVRLIVINKKPLTRQLSPRDVLREDGVGGDRLSRHRGQRVEKSSRGKAFSVSWCALTNRIIRSSQWQLCPVNRCEQKETWTPEISAPGEVCPVNRYSAVAARGGMIIGRRIGGLQSRPRMTTIRCMSGISLVDTSLPHGVGVRMGLVQKSPFSGNSMDDVRTLTGKVLGGQSREDYRQTRTKSV